MAVQTRLYTLEEFEQFIRLPENEDLRFEYMGGEIVEVVCNSYSSLVAGNLYFFIKQHLRENNLGYYATGEAGGYRIAGERYIPDVGVISKTRLAEEPHDTWIPLPPDLAVEVLSPTDRPSKVRTKIASYLAAGTVVWIVDPEVKEVELYTPGQAPKTLRIGDVLDGGEVLPGFKLAVKDIFEM